MKLTTLFLICFILITLFFKNNCSHLNKVVIVSKIVYITSFLRLKFVFKISRHGDRAPFPQSIYATDPYKNKTFWPNGWGELTNASNLLRKVRL